MDKVDVLLTRLASAHPMAALHDHRQQPCRWEAQLDQGDGTLHAAGSSPAAALNQLVLMSAVPAADMVVHCVWDGYRLDVRPSDQGSQMLLRHLEKVPLASVPAAVYVGRAAPPPGR